MSDAPPMELGYARTDLRRQLVDAVLRGEKTATAGLRSDYGPDERLPEPGDRSLLLGWDDEPVGVVETTEVRVVRAGDVDVQFARDEGEGFESVADWRAAHERFWAGQEITDDTLVVAERFRLVERYYAVEVEATDYHTAGEPFRIVTAGVPPIGGSTVAERREQAAARPDVDAVRRLLCHEPRGHADMYGCFLVPPDDDGADLGVLFWHKDGYSTACGHGTIALGAWAVESGARRRAAPTAPSTITIDVPSGRVVAARAHARRGRRVGRRSATCPSYVVARDVPAAGTTVDVAYGGALYASLPAERVGLAVTPERLPEIIAAGREIKQALAGTPVAQHPTTRGSTASTASIFHEELGAAPPAQRDRVRRRRDRPLAVRLGDLGAPRAAGRRRRARAGRRAASRLDRRHDLPRAHPRRDAGRRPDRGRGHRLPHRRAPLRARPARRAGHRVRAALNAP